MNLHTHTKVLSKQYLASLDIQANQMSNISAVTMQYLRLLLLLLAHAFAAPAGAPDNESGYCQCTQN
jgi:hypothetical protein